MKVGRNDLCPCGSGKKYKKCCLDKDTEARRGRNQMPIMGANIDTDIIDVDDLGDHGEPQISKEFFDTEISEQSMQKVISNIIGSPELEAMAVIMARRNDKKRGKSEEYRINTITDIDKLIEIMKQKPDPINHPALTNRVLLQVDEAIPKILEELKTPQPEDFIDLAMKVIYQSEKNLTNELVDLIKNPKGKRAYDLSIISLVLGLTATNEVNKVLWDLYSYLNKKYPGESYAQGPLLALSEIDHRSKILDVENEKVVEAIPEQFREKFDEAAINDIKHKLKYGRKIAAVHLFREKTEAGLEEAKNTIDNIEVMMIPESGR